MLEKYVKWLKFKRKISLKIIQLTIKNKIDLTTYQKPF